MLAAHAQENFAATMRQLSALWHGMSETEKDRYRAAAKQSAAGARTRSHSGNRRATSVSLNRITDDR